MTWDLTWIPDSDSQPETQAWYPISAWVSGQVSILSKVLGVGCWFLGLKLRSGVRSWVMIRVRVWDWKSGWDQTLILISILDLKLLLGVTLRLSSWSNWILYPDSRSGIRTQVKFRSRVLDPRFCVLNQGWKSIVGWDLRVPIGN